MRILALLLSALITTVSIPVAHTEPQKPEQYVLRAIVSSVENDSVSIVDEHGEEWIVSDEALSVGQEVTLIMNDNCTPENIYDDAVQDILYCNDCKED